MLLAALPPGARGHVRAVGGDPTTALRLRGMGVKPGTTLTVTARGASGSRIVSFGAARLAIDSATSALIEVEPT